MKSTRVHLSFLPVLLFFFACSVQANSGQLPRSSPEAQGVSSAGSTLNITSGLGQPSCRSW